MKEFIKSCLIEFSVIILVLSLFDGIEIREWRNFVIFSEILLVVLIFRSCSFLTDRIKNRFYILDVIIEFLISLAAVLFFGYVFGWYKLDRIGYMCFVGIVVYIISYILGVVGNKKSADYINNQLEKRRKRIEHSRENNSEN